MSGKTMTLEQVRDALRTSHVDLDIYPSHRMRLEWADAIDAAIKSREAKPIAECPDGQFSSVVTWLGPLPPKGTLLYTAPPAQPNVDRLIACMEEYLHCTGCVNPDYSLRDEDDFDEFKDELSNILTSP